MPAFFTTPTSQRKRKRPDAASGRTAFKKRNTANTASKAPKPSLPPADDESITGSSESDDDDGRTRPADDDNVDGEEDDTSGSDFEGETAAERRLRLAERYLENIREEVDAGGFDAEEIDRDLIAERLKEDVVCIHGLAMCGLKWIIG